MGYAVGGAFLGMSYFDLPYHLMIILVLTAKFAGVLKSEPAPAVTFVTREPVARTFG